MRLFHSTQAPLFFAALALGVGLTSCNSDDDNSGGGSSAPPSQTTVDDILSGVTVNDLPATIEVRTGDAPAGDAAGAVLIYSGGGTVAQGSTTQGQLSATDAFEAMVVSLEGVGGFYEIDLDAEQTSVDLFVSLAAEAPAGMINAMFQGRRTGDASFGEAVTVPLEVLEVGNGELQVNLTWNTDADLDIHVFEPDGNEIFWNNTVSSTGGQLDLDANVNCGNVSVENIFWDQIPPVGTYTVSIENFQACSQVASDFIITVTVPDQAPMLFTGSVTEADGLLEISTFDI
jgi:hypothetical protein